MLVSPKGGGLAIVTICYKFSVLKTLKTPSEHAQNNLP